MKYNELLNRPTPTPTEIAQRHGVDIGYVRDQLRQGIKVEMEHTKKPLVAREIALDHLSERPDYYERLSKVEEGQLYVDVPNDDWLQGKIEYAQSKKRNSFGVPYMGSTTAYTRDNVRVPVDILKRLPGMRGEQQNVRKSDLEAIVKIMKDTGKLPTLDNGKEYAPFINVAYNGEAWVNEGNHRIMAAAALGWKDMPVQISYFDGGERVKDGAMYPGKIGLGGTLDENFHDGKVKGKSRPGRVKRAGASCKGSVSSLRAKAKRSGGERGKMYHWCANMKSGRQKTNEGVDQQAVIRDFIPWVFEKLHIKGELPNIEFAAEKEGPDQDRTGFYDPNINKMWIYTGNRNLVDILRTLAHELAHHKQRTVGDTTHNHKTSDIESQADQAAGMLIKIYTKTHPEIIE